MTDRPKLARAIFNSRTHDEDKDHDTGVYVIVYKSDRKTMIAHIYDADRNQDGAGYSNDDAYHGVHSIELHVDLACAKDECEGFCYMVGIQATGGLLGEFTVTVTANGIPDGYIQGGNDDWRYDGDVVLIFDDGSQMQHKIDGQELNSRGGKIAWTGVA
jgi:hypothetical protein